METSRKPMTSAERKRKQRSKLKEKMNDEELKEYKEKEGFFRIRWSHTHWVISIGIRSTKWWRRFLP